jgi:hypothetical protein
MLLATLSNSGVGPLFRESQRRIAALLIMMTLILASGMPNANAGPRTTNISVTPVIKKITVQNGQLMASGAATTIVNGEKYVSSFKTPATLSLAADQSAAVAAGCPFSISRLPRST